MSKAAQNSTIEIPAPMIDTQADRMIDNFARRLQAQGMSMQQYMQFTGSDENMMREQVKPQAEIQIRNQLTLEKIAEAENIQVSDEESATRRRRTSVKIWRIRRPWIWLPMLL